MYLTPGNRKAHYFVGSESLCRRVGFYFSEVEKPGSPGGNKDCAQCRRLVARREAPRAAD